MCVANFMFEQNFNFTYSLGSKKSYIDHVFIPKYMCDQISKCNILEAEDNVSDHMVISATIHIPVTNHEMDKDSHTGCSNFPYARWSDLDFQAPFQQAMNTKDVPNTNVKYQNCG
jgi:hypothetical protein